MKALTANLSLGFDEVIIVPLADLHLGDPNCDYEEIQNHIDFIKNTPNAFCILNGDIINNATKTSVSDIYSEMLTPMQQIAKACVLLNPIKDKILCVTNGNHEFRTWRNDGIDLMAMMCLQLGIEEKYSPESTLLFLSFGRNTKGQHAGAKPLPMKYVIGCWHGSGGGRKEGAKAIRLADMASIVDADIYIHSHTHLPMVMKEAYFRTDIRSCSFQSVDKLFVNTSSMLNFGGYGESFEFKPSSKSTPYIYICGTERKFSAKL